MHKRKAYALILSSIIVIQTAFSPLLSIKASASTYDKIKDAGNIVKKKTESATDAAKKASEEATSKAKKAAENAGNAAKETVDNASKAAKDASEKAGKAAKEGSEKAKEKANEAGAIISDKAGQAYDSATSTARSLSDNITNYIASIDTEKFSAGWDYASKYTGTTIASLKGSTYVNSVQNQIKNTSKQLQEHLKSKVVSNRTVSQDAGFAAEIWHADSFNLDAALNGSEFKATVPDSNGKASADVIISGKDYSQDYSMKYYKDAESSANAQAKTFFEDYNEKRASSIRNGKTPLTEEEYLNQYDKPIDALYDSLYSGQGKIIPDDQLKEAKAYIKKRKLKADVSESIDRQKFSPELQETLDTLASRIEAPDGTKSSPLTEKQAKALVELTREDKDINLSDFNVTPSQLITTKYILKQALNAGAQSAIISTAFAIGPDVYTIIVDAAKEGKIDAEKLKETGIEGILSGSEGFVEGSVSSALVIACQSGKFGTAYTNIAPETIGTLTVLIIDAIRFGYQLSTGQITEAEYADLMSQDIIIAIASQSSGALVQVLFPFIPFAYVAGSMAGAMLASVGYAAGKELILEVRGENGFETVVPESLSSGKSLATSFMNNINIKDKLSDFKGMAVSTIGNGKLKIQNKSG